MFGEAICSFNPIYTQGMTVTALEVTALCESLYHSDEDLSRRFFDAAARIIEPPKPDSVLTEKLFRTMNLVDPPADYSPLLG